MTKFKLSIAALLLASTTLSANAAKIEVVPQTDKNGQYWLVYIIGDIKSGDDEKFRQHTQSLASQDVYLQLESAGGNLVAGINIGEQVYANRFKTRALDKCASVCGLIWLAGKYRLADTWSQIGFHAAYYTDDQSVTSEGNAVIGAYLSRLGFPYRTIQFLTAAPPNDMQWLTAENTKQYGIEVRYLSAKPTAPATPTKTKTNAEIYAEMSAEDYKDYSLCFYRARDDVGRVQCWNLYARKYR
jgi:hypothetical protein